MLVDYKAKQSQSKDFELVGSVEVGNHKRLFWEEIDTGRICCFWCISNKYNSEEMNIVHKEISPRVSSVSFAEGWKLDEEPKWKLTGLDENDNPKSVTYTHREMKELMTGSKLLDIPFELGKNYWHRHCSIEPKQKSTPTKGIF